MKSSSFFFKLKGTSLVLLVAVSIAGSIFVSFTGDSALFPILYPWMLLLAVVVFVFLAIGIICAIWEG